MKYFTGIKTLDELKAAYRRLAMKHHPDRGGDLKTIGGRNTARDKDGGKDWEYYDEVISTEHSTHVARLEMLARIADSEETIVRFEGDNYKYDLYVTDADKEMINDMFILYEAMLG